MPLPGGIPFSIIILHPCSSLIVFKYDKIALPAVFFSAFVGMDSALDPEMVISIPGVFFVTIVTTSDGYKIHVDFLV